MTSFLSANSNFIDVSTKEGLALLSNATDKFDCLLKYDECISLCSGGHDYQKLKDALLCCSQRFGYQHLLNNIVTNCVVTPAIQAVQADPNTNPPVQAVVGVPRSITYLNPIKVLEVYSDKLLNIVQKNASLFGAINPPRTRIQKKSLSLWLQMAILLTLVASTPQERKLFSNKFFPEPWCIKLWRCLPMKLVK